MSEKVFRAIVGRSIIRYRSGRPGWLVNYGDFTRTVGTSWRDPIPVGARVVVSQQVWVRLDQLDDLATGWTYPADVRKRIQMILRAIHSNIRAEMARRSKPGIGTR